MSSQKWLSGTGVVALALVLSACGPKAPADAPADAAASAPAPLPAAVEPAAAPAAPAVTPATAAAGTPFDVASLPMSTAPLGEFPYITAPEGYVVNGKTQVRDVDRFPFWVGDHFEWIIGKTSGAQFYPQDGKTFSTFEFQRAVDRQVTALGGAKVSEGQISKEARESLTSEITQQHNAGLGDIYNEPTVTYVIHRADKDIWIHAVIGSGTAAWTIAETEPKAAAGG